MSNVKFTFFLKTRKNTLNQHPIVLSITFNQDRTQLFTGVWIDKKKWNEKTKKIIMALHKQGMSDIEIAGHLDMFVGSVQVTINKELKFESVLERIKPELNNSKRKDYNGVVKHHC
jgi:hypothetical protein